MGLGKDSGHRLFPSQQFFCAPVQTHVDVSQCFYTSGFSYPWCSAVWKGRACVFCQAQWTPSLHGILLYLETLLFTKLGGRIVQNTDNFSVLSSLLSQWLSFVRKYLIELLSCSDKKSLYHLLHWVFWRGCGQDAGNPRVCVQSDYRLAKSGWRHHAAPLSCISHSPMVFD